MIIFDINYFKIFNNLITEKIDEASGSPLKKHEALDLSAALLNKCESFKDVERKIKKAPLTTISTIQSVAGRHAYHLLKSYFDTDIANKLAFQIDILLTSQPLNLIPSAELPQYEAGVISNAIYRSREFLSRKKREFTKETIKEAKKLAKYLKWLDKPYEIQELYTTLLERFIEGEFYIKKNGVEINSEDIWNSSEDFEEFSDWWDCRTEIMNYITNEEYDNERYALLDRGANIEFSGLPIRDRRPTNSRLELKKKYGLMSCVGMWKYTYKDMDKPKGHLKIVLYIGVFIKKKWEIKAVLIGDTKIKKGVTDGEIKVSAESFFKVPLELRNLALDFIGLPTRVNGLEAKFDNEYDYKDHILSLEIPYINRSYIYLTQR